jgi:hypothetical protein
MTYPEKLEAIATAIVTGKAHDGLTEYLKLRGDNLLRQLRTSTEENFRQIQGRLDENDKLMDLIQALAKLNEPNEPQN